MYLQKTLEKNKIGVILQILSNLGLNSSVVMPARILQNVAGETVSGKCVVQ